MNKITFTLFFSTIVLSSAAQLKTLTKLDLGLQGVGFTVEPRLGNNMTMDISAGAGGGYDVSSSSFSYNWNFADPAVYFSVTPKLFYNRSKRIARGKSVKYNSGNYFGLRLKYTTESIFENTDVWETFLVNIHWGMQRPVGRRWLFNTAFGIGYASDAADLYGTFYPALDVKFSYVFSKP